MPGNPEGPFVILAEYTLSELVAPAQIVDGVALILSTTGAGLTTTVTVFVATQPPSVAVTV